MTKLTPQVEDALAKCQKVLDEQPIPTEGRYRFDPETGEAIALPSKRKEQLQRSRYEELCRMAGVDP